MIHRLRMDALRPKLVRCMDSYRSLSENQSLTVGIYRNGEWFVLEEARDPFSLFYDIGSVSKTVTAHLILDLADRYGLDLNQSVSVYLDLPKGRYPTLYELLTHTAGYGHLTPWELTVPSLVRHGYARRNVYENCTSDTVLRCLKRHKGKSHAGYGYSDFPYAILAVVAEKITGRRFSDLFEEFVHEELNMRNTVIAVPKETRAPSAALGKSIVDFWKWGRDNPYLGAGGLVSNVGDMLTYLSLQIESDAPYITKAHEPCLSSLSKKGNVVSCIGWHTYKNSHQHWHVGGVGTFRSSVIFHRGRRLGVVVMGNSKGIVSANVHYLAKAVYSELKIGKIDLSKSYALEGEMNT